MNEDPTSLNRLHDIAMPPQVPWWPLAPGWYAVLGILLFILLFVIRRAWKSWQANAYRRAALCELAAAGDAATIAEILRRTALSVVPRQEIAGRTGAAWLDWLGSRFSGNMPEGVRDELSRGIYSKPSSELSTKELRDYAAAWIAHHKTTVS